jgi:alpha-tubulin suppressor-like RCC1 family protein
VRTNGIGQCWGLNWQGQLGLGDNTNRDLPRTVSGGLSWTSMTAGGLYSCGQDTVGLKYCWGTNNTYELGLGADRTSKLVPTTLSDDGAYRSLEAGGQTACGVSNANRLYCWGRNPYGQAGVGDSVPHGELPRVAGTTWSTVSVGGLHSCGVYTNGSTRCWGHNESGQLGTGNTTGSKVPVVVPNQTLSSVSAGFSHTCGISSADATLVCWGYNFHGQVGIGTRVNAKSPAGVA